VSGVIASHTLRSLDDLQELTPLLHRRLRHVVAKLRRLHGMDQEIEFTVDSGVLSVLQARTAATGIDKAPDRFCEAGEPVSRGLGVRGGCFRGLVAFDDADRAKLALLVEKRDDVDGVLVVLENPTPDDIPVIISADGLLTERGGSTSHAAVAANSIEEKPFCAVMSAQGLKVNAQAHEALFLDRDGQPAARVRRGDVLSIHGTTGEVHVGTRAVDRLPPRPVESSSMRGAAQSIPLATRPA
jgi:phosphoenolpyruvate synthase/pyruvate phosphate dikinase